jgi:hypothetical protein
MSNLETLTTEYGPGVMTLKSYSSRSNARRALNKELEKAGMTARELFIRDNTDGTFTGCAVIEQEADEQLDPAAESVNADTFTKMFMVIQHEQNLSKCATLRAVAHAWKGTRQEFLKAAINHGIKPATASANWAAKVRGEW